MIDPYETHLAGGEPMDRARTIRITERNDRFQVLSALKSNRKKRNELGELFVEGIEAIKQALASDAVSPASLLFAERSGLSDWARGLIESGRFERTVSLRKDLYDELSDKVEPAEIMATFAFRKRTLEDVALPDRPFIVIFDRPSDHGNLGSLIRSANAFGVDLVITHGHCVDHFDPKTIRSSLGAVFRTPVVHVESFPELTSWIAELKRKTWLIAAGTDSTGSVPLSRAGLSRPVALILGNEAKGMSIRLKEIADIMVRIPLSGAVNSLNVACAGSILLWTIAERSET
jgi:tRNA G18 (ribose-2'-O)-methylase SpoU